MWNTKSDTFGWNLDRDTSNLNYNCNFCKEDNKCTMSSLIHCDHRKDGKCTQYESECNRNFRQKGKLWKKDII